MKTKAEHVANVLAVAIWADGVYDDAERATVKEIAEGLGYDTLLLDKLVEGGVGGMLQSTDENVNNILQASAKEIVPSEKGPIYEAVIEVVLSDSVIAYDETERLLEVANALGIDMKEAITLFADMVNPDMDVKEDVDAVIASANGGMDALVKGVIDLCDKIHSPETFVIEK